MNTVSVVLLLLLILGAALTALGYLVVRHAHETIVEQKAVADDLGPKFRSLAAQYAEGYHYLCWPKWDEDLYQQLLTHADEYQSRLGWLGPLVRVEERTGRRSAHSFVQVLMNMHTGAIEPDATRNWADNTVRHSSILDNRQKALHNQLRDPRAWFREGVTKTLQYPFAVLRDVGVVSDARLATITTGRAFGLLVYVVLLTFQAATGIATILTIVESLGAS